MINSAKQSIVAQQDWIASSQVLLAMDKICEKDFLTMPYTQPGASERAAGSHQPVVGYANSPTPGMREAMARAEVGDEQIGDDPTTNLLCERVAGLSAKGRGVQPSGPCAMCRRRCRIAGPATRFCARDRAYHRPRRRRRCGTGGFQVHQAARRGREIFARYVSAALHPRTRYEPPPAVSASNRRQYRRRHHLAKADLDAIAKTAKANGMVTHMDGRAAAEPACIATGISASDMSAGWDSVWKSISQKARRADRPR